MVKDLMAQNPEVKAAMDDPNLQQKLKGELQKYPKTCQFLRDTAKGTAFKAQIEAITPEPSPQKKVEKKVGASPKPQ